MRNFLEFLESTHKSIGAVAGEVCIAVTIRRVPGGVRAMRRWVENLRIAADAIEAQADRLEERRKVVGR